jgi:hypothetical protein
MAIQTPEMAAAQLHRTLTCRLPSGRRGAALRSSPMSALAAPHSLTAVSRTQLHAHPPLMLDVGCDLHLIYNSQLNRIARRHSREPGCIRRALSCLRPAAAERGVNSIFCSLAKARLSTLCAHVDSLSHFSRCMALIIITALCLPERWCRCLCRLSFSRRLPPNAFAF